MSDIRFKVSSGLKSIIGRDLITDDFLAIFELVKNSFDAQAKNVRIIFDLHNKETAAIYVIDNGKGMSETDIKEKWLFVAYSAKKNGEEDSDTNHVYAGSKGIGRFSCDRLGQNLLLQSKTIAQDIVNNVQVDWGIFENQPKLEFDNISIQYYKSQTFSVPSTSYLLNDQKGTILKISNLREYESWDRKKLLRLKRSLQKLLDPFSGTLSERAIEIVCQRELGEDENIENQEQKINGFIGNNIFKSFLNTSTVIHSDFKDTSIETSLIDRGILIYRISEKIDNSYFTLTSCKIRCDIAFLNRAAKSAFHKRMGIESVKFGSVFLIHNGFRIYPIGEEIDDFWGLNRRKQQGYNRYLGTREVLGCVHIDDPANIFQEASNREGLVASSAVEGLQYYLVNIVKRLEAYLNRVTWKDPSDSFNLTPESLNKDETRARIINLIKDMASSGNMQILEYNNDLISILDSRSEKYEDSLADLRAFAKQTNDPSLIMKLDHAEDEFRKLHKKIKEQQLIAQGEQKARQTAEKAAEDAHKEAQKNRNQYEEERKRTLFLMTDAPRDKDFLESFMHQILKYASEGTQKIQNFQRFGNKSPEKMSELCERLLYLFEKIYSASHFATMADFRLNAEYVYEDLPLFISQYAEKVCMGFNGSMTIESIVPKTEFIIKFNPMEMGLIIENIASNSRKAHASKLVINMSIASGGNELIIIFSDNGVGLAEGFPKERIFEKGFSRTNGSGLGLYTCKWVAERMKASFELSSNGHIGNGVSFTMRFTK